MNRTHLLLIVLVLLVANLSCDRNRFRAKVHTDDLARTWLWSGEGRHWLYNNGTTYTPVADTAIAIVKLSDRSIEFLGRKFDAEYKVGSGLDRGEVRYLWTDVFDRAEIRYYYKRDSVIYRYYNSRSSHSDEIVLIGK